MARNCVVCGDSRVAEIDAALLGTEADGCSYRSIAKRFSLGESSVYRHWKAHLPVRLAKELKATGMDASELLNLPALTVDGPASEASAGSEPGADLKRIDLVDHLGQLHADTLAILRESKTAGRHEIALKAVREARGTVELAARLEGKLDSHASGVTVQVAIIMPDAQPGAGTIVDAELKR